MGISCAIFLILLFSESASGQSVLSKFKELNVLLEETVNQPKFLIEGNGFVTIEEKDKASWKFHFTDIEKADSLWEDEVFILFVQLKDDKLMNYSKRKSEREKVAAYRIPFKHPDHGRKSLKKLQEALEIGKPRSRVF